MNCHYIKINPLMNHNYAVENQSNLLNSIVSFILTIVLICTLDWKYHPQVFG